MLRELLLSVASGVIVALILQIFGVGRRRNTAPRQPMRNYHYAPPRRRSFFGRVIRLILSVAGGIAIAQAAAPLILRRRFGDFGDYDRYDRVGGFGDISNHVPILVMTVIGTIIVYMVLSIMTRRS
jgi:hypothetical protein